MIKAYCKVITINEENLEGVGKAYQILMYDQNNQYYDMFYIGELSDIFQEDIVNVVGLPLGLAMFANSSGGSTHTIPMVGSYLEKEQ